MTTTKTLTIPNGYWIASELADRTLTCGFGAEIWGDGNPADALESIVFELLEDAGLECCEECWGFDDVVDVNGDEEPAWRLCEWCRDGIAEARAYDHVRSIRY